MKSNIQKLGNKVIKALKTQSEVLIIPKSHNELNQIEIALRRVGIIPNPDWTPHFAQAVCMSRDEVMFDDTKNVLLGRFDGPKSPMQVTVNVFWRDDEIIADVHNHMCGHKTWITL